MKVDPGKGKSEKAVEPSIDSEKGPISIKEGTLSSLPEGRLGKLRIHQSGKVTMQLGDHIFIIDGGTQVSYLQVHLQCIYICKLINT